MIDLTRVPTQQLVDMICHTYGWTHVKYSYSDKGVTISMYSTDGDPIEKFVDNKKICELFVWGGIKIGELYTDITPVSAEERAAYFKQAEDAYEEAKAAS